MMKRGKSREKKDLRETSQSQARSLWRVFAGKILHWVLTSLRFSLEPVAVKKQISENNKGGYRSTPGDWLRVVNTLQPLILHARAQIAQLGLEAMTFEMIGVNTYLYQIDKLLEKAKEHFIVFRLRQKACYNKKTLLWMEQPEYVQAEQACIQCYCTLCELLESLQRQGVSNLSAQNLQGLVSILVLELSALSIAMKKLNALFLQVGFGGDEVLTENQQTSKTLILRARNALPIEKPIYPLPQIAGESLLGGEVAVLKKNALLLKNEADVQFVMGLIEVYDLLKKCYVVDRKEVVVQALDEFFVHLSALMACLVVEKEAYFKLHRHLFAIYCRIETLRFSAHRESRCGLNLFEKTKLARKMMRAVCQKTDYGVRFLENIQIKDASKVKRLLKR